MVRMLRDASAFVVAIEGDLGALLGWAPGDLIGKPSTEFIHPQDQGSAVAAWMTMVERPGSTVSWRGRYRTADGDWRWIEAENTNRLDDPDGGRVVTTMRPVQRAELSVEEQLRAREELLDRLVDALPVGILHFDVDGLVLGRNDRLDTVLGVRAGSVAELLDVVAADQRRSVADAFTSVIEDRVAVDGLEFDVETPDGWPVVCSISVRCLTDVDGAVAGGIATLDDITDRARLRRQLERRAATDQLTGCLNRWAIVDAMSEMSADLAATGGGAAVVFVDLDRFKEVNDTHGHAAGDAVLTTTARAIRGAIRDVDVVGRHGGDEFMVLCPGVPSRAIADGIADRVRAATTLTIDHHGRTIRIAASVGVTHTDRPVPPAELVQRADAAMYAAKQAARREPSAVGT